MYLDDYRWQLPWLPSLKGVLGEAIIRKSKLIEDRMHGTDLVLFEEIPGGLRIACRVRRPEILQYGRPWYAHQVTFTSRRETGGPNESQKIIFDKEADWFVYAHATAQNPIELDLHGQRGRLDPVVILDLAIIRPYVRDRWDAVRELPNRDPIGKRCFFKAFSLYELREHCGSDAIRLARPALSEGPFCQCCWDPALPDFPACAECSEWISRAQARRFRAKKKNS